MDTGSLRLYLPGQSRWLPAIVLVGLLLFALLLLALAVAPGAGYATNMAVDPQQTSPFRWASLSRIV